MPILKRAIAAFVLLALAGCAVPTPYKPADDGFGYSEQQIEDNRYRVSFAGNSATPRDVVQDYLLYRAAELTLENGYDYFTMVSQNLERSTRYIGQGITSFSPTGRHFDSVGFGVGVTSYTARPIDNYTAIADIVLFKGEKPPDDVNAYDARDVIPRLRAKIARPKA